MNKANNYAYIDGQNLYKSFNDLDWKLDYKKFRIYLKEKYKVKIAYIFMGFIEKNQSLYNFLEDRGYQLIYKNVTEVTIGKIKGNVDAELVLQAMIDYESYEKAVIVTSDGDFSCLVTYFDSNNKLECVISPQRDKCSKLLRKAAKSKMFYLDTVQSKLEYVKNKKEKHRRRTKP